MALNYYPDTLTCELTSLMLADTGIQTFSISGGFYLEKVHPLIAQGLQSDLPVQGEAGYLHLCKQLSVSQMLNACNRKKVLRGVGLQYVGHHDPMMDPSKLKLFSKQKVDW